MTVSTVEKTMLYCPKCNTTYEDESQRFCLNDGGRLLPAPSSIKAAANSKGIFSSVLRNSPENESVESDAPRVFVAESLDEERNTFHTNFSSKVFKENSEVAPKVSEEGKPPKPVVRLIRPNEIPSGTANIGDRKSNPTGRTALTWENPNVLIGQTVKGRYRITDTLSEDDSSISYLAEDKIIAEKEMIVRVLMDEETDDFLSRIFAEERVSLSHINHPNIVRVLDSGELPEGKPFIVTEMVDGFSAKEKLEVLEKFEPSRAAKIIRQASNALSELHQNGILHRNLRLDNIFLTITDAVTEQVKVTDFAVSGNINRQNFENVKYMSPEQLEGRLPNYASDIYSLGVIAYEMLTGKHPFEAVNADKLLKAQKKGLYEKISGEPHNLPLAAEEAIEKALAYEPSERFAKARDFGDALYQAVISYKAGEENAANPPTEFEEPIPMPQSAFLIPAKTNVSAPDFGDRFQVIEPSASMTKLPDAGVLGNAKKTSEEVFWEKRSPEPFQKGKSSRLWLALLAILTVLIAGWIIWQYVLKSAPQTTENIQNSATQTTPNIETANATEKKSPIPAEIESPPPARNISQPANTEYFQNSDANLTGEAAKNFLGFSLYYPKTWQKNESKTNFIDVSKNAESGTPIEQFLVSYYQSKGTFNLDKELFPKLVENSNKTLAEIVPNYRLVSESEKTINNGWKVYEMSFEGAGETANGEKINLWGKRLFIPTALSASKSGYVVTMLATSLSPDVKSVADVGSKGEIAQILETFEPTAAR